MDMRKKIFCIVGETCSGKDTLVRKLQEYDPETFRPVVSFTNRPIREGEEDGREHYFLTDDQFTEKRYMEDGRIVAYTKISTTENSDGYEYMATLDEVMKSSIYVIDPQGLEYLKTNFNDKIDAISIYISCPYEMRQARAKENRSDFNTAFEKRVESERWQFDNFVKQRKYDYIVYNYDGMEALAFRVLFNIIQYEMNTRNIRTEPETILGEDYQKGDLIDAASYLKSIHEFYKSHITNKNHLVRKIESHYAILRNLILSHIR